MRRAEPGYFALPSERFIADRNARISAVAKREAKRIRDAKKPSHRAGETYEVYVPPVSNHRGS